MIHIDFEALSTKHKANWEEMRNVVFDLVNLET